MAAVAPNSITGEREIKPQLVAYEAQQDVGGVVTLHVAPGKKIEHLGIKVQFIGRIDTVRPIFTTVGLLFLSSILISFVFSSRAWA